MATEAILGVFAHVDTTVRALEELRARGYHDLTVYTPLPVHEIEEVLERDRPVSRVRLFTLIGGLSGIASAFLLTIWSSLVWGQVTGGKFMQLVPGGLIRFVLYSCLHHSVPPAAPLVRLNPRLVGPGRHPHQLAPGGRIR